LRLRSLHADFCAGERVIERKGKQSSQIERIPVSTHNVTTPKNRSHFKNGCG
jgi:hypothetical protein